MIVTLKDIQQSIRDHLDTYDNLFEDYLRANTAFFSDVIDYILSKRGKGIRPLLLLLCSNMCKGISDKSLHAAVAVELLHTATLIHDDVVDEATMRRGEQTINERWNNKKAILIGDYLLSIVLQIFSQLHSHQLYTLVSEVSKNLAMGELLQLQHQKNIDLTDKDYFSIIKNKTANLFALCAQIGALTSGATPKQTRDLYNFGMNLGMCFQMKDDILDYSDEEDTGKSALNDIKTGKITLPLLISLQRATREETEEIKMLLHEIMYHQQKNDFIKNFDQVIRSFVLRYDGIYYTYQAMMKYKNKATESLNNFHNENEKDALEKLLLYVMNRNY